MAVCAAPEYLARRGTPSTLDELQHHEAITYNRSGRTRAWLFSQDGLAQTEIVPPSRMRFDDLEAIADAAAASFGLAWLPSWLVSERVQRGDLTIVLSNIPSATFDAQAVWPRIHNLPLRVRLAINALVDQLPGVLVS